MRRINLLMTVAAVVVVGALFAVSVAGAHKHPTAKAQKHPTRTVLIQASASSRPTSPSCWVRWSVGSTRTPLRTPRRRTTQDGMTPDVWVKDRGIHTSSRARGRRGTTARYIPI